MTSEKGQFPKSDSTNEDALLKATTLVRLLERLEQTVAAHPLLRMDVEDLGVSWEGKAQSDTGEEQASVLLESMKEASKHVKDVLEELRSAVLDRTLTSVLLKLPETAATLQLALRVVKVAFDEHQLGKPNWTMTPSVKEGLRTERFFMGRVHSLVRNANQQTSLLAEAPPRPGRPRSTEQTELEKQITDAGRRARGKRGWIQDFAEAHDIKVKKVRRIWKAYCERERRKRRSTE